METIWNILMVVGIFAIGLLVMLFRSWFYGKDGPMDSIGMSDDEKANLDKLLDRGAITQEEYEDALEKLGEEVNEEKLL